MATVTISSGHTSSGLIVSSGASNELIVSSGGTIVGATVLSGGLMIVSGTDSGSVISAAGSETLLGTAIGDQLYGTQLISAASAVVNSETVFAGGVAELFLKGAVTSAMTLMSGGELAISGNASATNTVINGGTLLMESAKAVISGGLTFSSGGTLDLNTVISAVYGELAVISGFTTGDMILDTGMGAAATLTSATTASTTVETLTSGLVSQTFTFAGTTIGGDLYVTAAGGGVELLYSAGTVSSGNPVNTVSSGATQSNMTVSAGSANQLLVLSGGSVSNDTVLTGASATISGTDQGSTIDAGGIEIVIGSANADRVFGVQSATGSASNETIENGGTVVIAAGGAMTDTSILLGGSAVIAGTDTGTTISSGGSETVQGAGTVSGDSVYGTQLLSGATAVANAETIYNGGTVDLFLAGVKASALTVEAGATLAISGAATATNTTINGGTVFLESPKAMLWGGVTIANSGTIEITSASSAGYGVQGAISGFTLGDVIDITVMGAGSTLSTAIISGNTVATLSSGSVTQDFTFGGTIGLNMVADGGTGGRRRRQLSGSQKEGCSHWDGGSDGNGRGGRRGRHVDSRSAAA